MPITFHILDVCARDEKIISTNTNEKYIQYSHADDSDDDEFKPVYKKDGSSYKNDHSGKETIIHLFGRTVEGTSLRCDVKGYKPFFFLRSPDGPEHIQKKAKSAIEDYIGRHIKPQEVADSIRVSLCNRKELFGFTQNKSVPMLKVAAKPN